MIYLGQPENEFRFFFDQAHPRSVTVMGRMSFNEEIGVSPDVVVVFCSLLS